MELQKIDVVDLQPLERLVELAGGGLLGAAVDLGHQEGLLAVAVLEGLAHPLLALAVVVIPGVVEEIEAAVERRADDLKALLLGDPPDVSAADADEGDLLPRAPEGAVRHPLPHLGGPGESAGAHGHRGSGRQLQELTPGNSLGWFP